MSCGLEDAYAVSHLLAYRLSAGTLVEREAVQSALQQYEAVRKPHVERILDAAIRMGDQKRKKGVIEEWVTYIVLYFIRMSCDKKYEEPQTNSVSQLLPEAASARHGILYTSRRRKSFE